MSATPLTPELYNELKRENYKYLVYKRTKEKSEGIYEPVKELPNHLVISLNSIEDESIKESLGAQRILIDY